MAIFMCGFAVQYAISRFSASVRPHGSGPFRHAKDRAGCGSCLNR
jgi:hypothetical protein